MTGGILVLAAPSGTGKTTVARALVEGSERFRFSVSATTRPPRGDEVDGREYHFVDDAAFDALVEEGRLLEWAHVHGRRYGTPVAEVDRIVEAHSFAVLDIDVQGALQVRERAPGAVLVFLLPPSGSELVSRLTRRGTDRREEVGRRLVTAAEELDRAEQFDYCVVNREVADTVATVTAIAEAESRRSHRIAGLSETIEGLKREIAEAAARAGL